MPVYQYQCVDCGGTDLRVGSNDDQAAICRQCGGLMLRLDILEPCFGEEEKLADSSHSGEKVVFFLRNRGRHLES